MSAINYRLVEKNMSGGLTEPYIEWGVALYDGSELLRVIDGISADREAVHRLVDLFNEEELDPVHLDQAVEDYLYDFEI